MMVAARDLTKFFAQHREAVVCQYMIIAGACSHDSTKAAPTIVGYHLAQFSLDGYIVQYLDQDLVQYDEVCLKARVEGRRQLRQDLADLCKQREKLIDIDVVDIDQQKLRDVEKLVFKLETELDKIKA